MKTAVSTYSFYNYISKGEMTVEDSIKKAKEMGFDAVEVTTINGNPEEQKAMAESIRKTADELDMLIICYTVGGEIYHEESDATNAEIERLKGHVDLAVILGAPVMRHNGASKLGKTGCNRSYDLLLPKLADAVRAVTEYAETKGIKTCVENHGFINQDSDRMERLFNAVNHDNFGLLVDFANFNCADEDPAIATSRVAPYAFHVHVKDQIVSDTLLTGETGAGLSRAARYIYAKPLGEGTIPLERCLTIMKNWGYDGYYSLEYEAPEDPISGIAKSLETLKKAIEKLR